MASGKFRHCRLDDRKPAIFAHQFRAEVRVSAGPVPIDPYRLRIQRGITPNSSPDAIEQPSREPELIRHFERRKRPDLDSTCAASLRIRAGDQIPARMHAAVCASTTSGQRHINAHSAIISTLRRGKSLSGQPRGLLPLEQCGTPARCRTMVLSSNFSTKSRRRRALVTPVKRIVD